MFQPNSLLSGSSNAPGKPSAADEVSIVMKVSATMTHEKWKPLRCSQMDRVWAYMDVLLLDQVKKMNCWQSAGDRD
jgi:hypothetical protein